ncbi:enoyl-CoA hydratase/carnithine racemase [Paraburkholderia sp. MM5477-R1]
MARPMHAVKAEKLGLADEIVAAGCALEAARKMAKRFADGPPLSRPGADSGVSLVLRSDSGSTSRCLDIR